MFNNQKVLLVVCLAMVGVSAQGPTINCPDAVTCIENLGYNFSDPIQTINQVCGGINALQPCYTKLMNCPDLPAYYASQLPSFAQLKVVLTSACANKAAIISGISCVSLHSVDFNTQGQVCLNNIVADINGMGVTDPSQLTQKQICKLTKDAVGCLTTMKALQDCGTTFSNLVAQAGQDAIPSQCSGAGQPYSMTATISLIFVLFINFLRKFF